MVHGAQPVSAVDHDLHLPHIGWRPDRLLTRTDRAGLYRLCNLTGARFEGDLTGYTFVGAILHDADFANARLESNGRRARFVAVEGLDQALATLELQQLDSEGREVWTRETANVQAATLRVDHTGDIVIARRLGSYVGRQRPRCGAAGFGNIDQIGSERLPLLAVS